MPRASINPLAQISRLDLNGPLASAKSPAIRRTRPDIRPRRAPRCARKVPSSASRDMADFARGGDDLRGEAAMVAG